MIDSLLLAVVAMQASAGRDLPDSLRQDIEAAVRAPDPLPAIEPLPPIVPIMPPPPLPPPPPPPPPPGPDVFGTLTVAEKVGLDDDRWIRIGALRARSPILAALIRRSQGGARYQQASSVQATINGRIVYRLDQDNWGEADYWASADETIARGAGDCEDFALLKLQALRLLGFEERDLFFMVGTKVSGQDHALLLVRIDGHFWVMDDGVNRLVPAESFRIFRPAFSYSAGWKWSHSPR